MTGRVTVEIAGKVITGTYCVANQFLSVSFGNTSKTTLYHGVRPQHLAKQLLRQLVLRSRSGDH
jgi:hypothetical protein